MPLDGQVLRVTPRMQIDGEDIFTNVYHCVKLTGGTQSNLAFEQGVAQFMDDLYDNINPHIPDDLAYIDIQIFNVTTSSILTTQLWPALTNGLAIADELPTQNVGLVIGRTTTPRVLARKSLGPFGEESWGGQTWSAGLLTNLANFAADWLATLVLDGIHQYAWGALNRALGTLTPIDSTLVIPGARTQRRRTRGFGT